MKKIILHAPFFAALTIAAQNVGIGNNTPQATLDVKGNQRMGGTANYMTFDSASVKIEWKNANIYAPVSQALMKHSAAANGLVCDNVGGEGKIEYVMNRATLFFIPASSAVMDISAADSNNKNIYSFFITLK